MCGASACSPLPIGDGPLAPRSPASGRCPFSPWVGSGGSHGASHGGGYHQRGTRSLTTAPAQSPAGPLRDGGGRGAAAVGTTEHGQCWALLRRCRLHHAQVGAGCRAAQLPLGFQQGWGGRACYPGGAGKGEWGAQTGRDGDGEVEMVAEPPPPGIPWLCSSLGCNFPKWS